MRKLLMIGTALAMIAAVPASALADGHHHGNSDPSGGALFACVLGGLFGGSAQVQCAANDINSGYHGSDDWNTQGITQSQTLTAKKKPWGTAQLQVGLNLVNNGDGNSQDINQSQTLTDNSYHHHGGPEILSFGPSGPTQLQVGTNVVQNGDNNTQTISQTQTATFGESHDNDCGCGS